jgi:hypothetical protein
MTIARLGKRSNRSTEKQAPQGDRDAMIAKSLVRRGLFSSV